MSRPIKILIWSVASLLIIIALAVIILITFDWNRAKPWLNARVSEATGRSFVIRGNLSLTWHKSYRGEAGWRGWVPWPRLAAQDVTLGNPEWAKTSPNMAEVKGLTFSVSPLPLFSKKIIIPTLYFDTPILWLERLPDGKNNWTFPHKDPSKWQIDLQDLVLDKGVLNLQDAVKKLNFRADVDTLDDPKASKYGIAWKVSGTFNNAPVSGGGRVGAVLSLQDKEKPYPIEANIKVGKTTVGIDGTLNNPIDPSGVDVELKLSGASLAHLYALSGIVLPETPPFSTKGHLIAVIKKYYGSWTYQKFTGKVGSSDLLGTLEYQSTRPRPVITGEIVSKLLKFEDLAPLIGADSQASKAKRDAPNNQPADKVLPVEPFHTERWDSIDADVKFTGQKILHGKELPIENLVAQIHLKDSILSLTPLNFGVAGGHFISNIKLNGRDKIIKAEMKISARHLKLKQLFPTFQPMHTSLGEVNAEASLSSTGNSIAAMLGSSNGEIKALINEGTISKLLLEELGLNIGNIVLTKLFGDKQVPLNCLAADFKVTNGLMQERIFVIDTSDAILNIDGNIDLKREQLALVINQETKGLRIISLRAPIYITGSFKKPSVDVDKGVMALKAGAAIALAAAAPVAALLPLVNVGPKQSNECANLLAAVGGKPVAPPPGKTYQDKKGSLKQRK